MQTCYVNGSWWKSLNKPKPYAFALLILLGVLLEYVVHYQTAYRYRVYTFLLPYYRRSRVMYGRKAILIAIFFGILHITDTYLTRDPFSGCTHPRLHVCIVAFVVGLIAEQMNCYRDRLLCKTANLRRSIPS